MPDTNQLEPPDQSQFEFVPNRGFRFHGDGRSILLRALAITKPNEHFDNEQLFKYARITQAFADDIDGFEFDKYQMGVILDEHCFPKYNKRYAYKFVAKDTYERYIAKDSLLLSSLERFRRFEVEGNAAGDRFEGASLCAYKVSNRTLYATTLSSFDTFAFSMAADLENADEMRKKFGPIVLRMDVKPLVHAIEKAIRTTSSEVRLVQYTDLKLYRGRLPFAKVAGFPPVLSTKLAIAFCERGRLPSVFAKPRRFATEREVRISIITGKDVEASLSVCCPNHHEYVTRID